MDCTPQRDLDPLDLEVVERAVQGALDATKFGSDPVDLESDEDLELALRRELAQMVRASGVSDADVLVDMLMEGTSEKVSEPRPQSQARTSPASASTASDTQEASRSPYTARSNLY